MLDIVYRIIKGGIYMILYVSIMKTVDKSKDKEVLEEHIAYLNKYIANGKIFAKGPFLDHTGGMVILKVDSIDEARDIVENDPAIKEGSREYILKEWRSNIED